MTSAAETEPVPTRSIILLAGAGFASQAMVRVTDSLLPQIAADFGTTVGAASIIVHIENNANLLRTVQLVKSFGKKAGVVINPATPAVGLVDILPDVDLILVLPQDWDFEAELNPDRYNLLSKRRVRQRFGFDILAAREYSEQYAEYLALFQGVRGHQDLRKGILRIPL